MSNRIILSVSAIMLVVSITLFLTPGCIPIEQEVETTTSQNNQDGLDTSVLLEAWQIIEQEYVELDRVDAEVLIQGAVRGMVEALDDPYSSFLDEEDFMMTTGDLSGTFEGIGAYVGANENGNVIIIAPIPGSPADRAGIRSGDVIMAIEGESAIGINVQEAVMLIRGPQGTPVELLILHEGETEPVEIEIVRDEIELASVLFEMEGDIAHITITNFHERTDSELAEVLEAAVEQEAAAIILDLRGNPGGLLESVVDVVSRFIDRGVVVSVVDNQGNREETSVRHVRGASTDLPMVILVNSYSASGSEVLAGALQDYGRAVVAGSITFGKGSVNHLLHLSDGSGIYLTVARWYTPHGRLIEGEGIAPDIELTSEEDAVQWAIDYLKNQM